MKNLLCLDIEDISIEFFDERYDSIRKSPHYLNMLNSDVEYLKNRLENTSAEYANEIELCLHNLRILTVEQKPDTYKKIFDAVVKQADLFEKEHGNLNEGSDFDLYGKYLEKAIIEFNNAHNVDFDIEETLNIWSAYTNYKYFDEDMEFMDEALENWSNLQTQ